MDLKSRIFASAFPVPSLSHTTPTPLATPDLGFTFSGQPFGSPFVAHPANQNRAVRRNLAWSTATRFLSLPKVLRDGSFHGERRVKNAEVEDALQYLLVGDGKGIEGGEQELVEWYTNEVRLHFTEYIRPALNNLWEKPVPLQHTWDVLEKTQHILHHYQDLCLRPVADHIVPVFNGATFSSSATFTVNNVAQTGADLVCGRLRRDIHALFAYSLPRESYSKCLSYVLYDAGCRLFRIKTRRGGVDASITASENTRSVHARMTTLLQGLENVGLGGDNAQKAFAHAMDKLMDSFISSNFVKVDWQSRSSVVDQLYAWVENGFSPLVELVLECLACSQDDELPSEMQQWQDMMLGRLGRARVANLFDFVLNWDKSLGAILDIKEYLRTPGAKQHLTSSFSQQLSRRLLHAGATTTHILNVYISIIRVFHELEPKGVLLERVTRPVRRYLRERNDTGRIIISSLLTDTSDEHGTKFGPSSELSYEIAREMQNPINMHQDGDDELNWNDLNWQPLPTDASPEYRKAKVQDVIWFLLTLWDRDDFITEMKSIFGEHLLHCQDPEYEKEIQLLELIKTRLGENNLQACEVMLRDILQSKRFNATICPKVSRTPVTPRGAPRTPDNGPKTPHPRHQTRASTRLQTPSTYAAAQEPAISVQIISSHFWPTLRDDLFKIPAPISALQSAYATKFESIQQMRKLDFMPALGDTTVSLELEDRTIEVNATTWQAAVIYAFQPQPGEEWTIAEGGKGKGKGKAKTQPITRNVEQLEEMLEMDETLIRQAIAFWIGESVLRESDTDTYTVLETLPSTTDPSSEDAASRAAAAAQAQAASAAVKSAQDLLNEKKLVYKQFVLGMLTNQGNMPLAKIMMMLKIVVPGGFPYGVDELMGLLGEMESVGELGGGVWGVRK